MRKRIYRGASFILLALSIPAIGWGLKEKEVISNATSTTSDSVQAAVTSTNTSTEELFTKHITEIYDSAHLSTASLNFEVFKKALTGYYHLKGNFKVSGDKQIISIVDFTKPSSQKRLWIVDLAKRKVLFHTLVAHGRGSGGLMAEKFSNTSESHQSSLGFYVTDDTYIGKHGLSLRLKGLDKGYNTNALARAIVVHGADYVSQNFVSQNGYLGRSHGCPAVPVELTNDIIKTIKGKTAMFLYSGSTPVSYSSNLLDAQVAANTFMSANQSLATL
ncbi:MAG: murein L,D-transpeptidase catalytic domain family protein [Sphingobacteriaceae bacterium]|nr:murein L,D-transpeptidase catalytic domain family protein [Sphingobacteriaceae bacterium]